MQDVRVSPESKYVLVDRVFCGKLHLFSLHCIIQTKVNFFEKKIVQKRNTYAKKGKIFTKKTHSDVLWV